MKQEVWNFFKWIVSDLEVALDVIAPTYFAREDPYTAGGSDSSFDKWSPETNLSSPKRFTVQFYMELLPDKRTSEIQTLVYYFCEVTN